MLDPKKLKLDYDPEVDAAYLTLRPGKVVESEEVRPGLVVDFGAGEQVIGIEILRFSRRFQSRPIRRQRATRAKSGRAGAGV
jgi:uncharacterized protein YuzE